jgi:hypothetical protein
MHQSSAPSLVCSLIRDQNLTATTKGLMTAKATAGIEMVGAVDACPGEPKTL